MLDCEDVEDNSFEETESENQVSEEHEIPIISRIKEEITESPFETVICGSEVEIKREVEDERDCFGSLEESTGSNICTQSAINIYPSNEPLYTPVDPLLPVPVKRRRISKTKVLPIKKPKPGFERCEICKNEYFLSHLDLLEHRKFKHPETVKVSEPIEVNPSEYASTSKEPPLVSFGQPSRPPFSGDVAGCDVSDGFFVSLKNIPMARRKAAKDKIMELVNLITSQDLEPSSLRFLVDNADN